MMQLSSLSKGKLAYTFDMTRKILFRVESRDPETALPVPVVCLAVRADLLLVQFGIAVSAGDALPGVVFIHPLPQ